MVKYLDQTVHDSEKPIVEARGGGGGDGVTVLFQKFTFSKYQGNLCSKLYQPFMVTNTLPSKGACLLARAIV